MTTPSVLDDDAGCPEAAPAWEADGRDAAGTRPTTEPGKARLTATFVPFSSIDPARWDALADASPAATPFSRHCVHAAWWQAYGGSAHDQTMIVTEPSRPDEPVAIVPLMHRHELEPGDVAARTALRHTTEPRTPTPPSATAVFFGASYHADYATVLTSPDRLAAVADAAVDALATSDAPRWDCVDLRRLRCGDPATDALADAFRRRADRDGWRVTVEREDVCPILTLPEGADFETYLGTLDKKERHEIRRKIRRAEAAGEVRFDRSSDPPGDLDEFVDLHQKRWGVEGLFPETEGGAASRRFFAGLFGDCGDLVDLSFLTVGGRRIAAGVTFDDGESLYYYNAGVDPAARDLSPGVVMVACAVRRAIDRGRRRLDFLRGDEPYKYTWGAVDEPIQRLLVERTGGYDAANTRTVDETEAGQGQR